MNDFTKLRFHEEEILVKILEDDFALKNYYEIFDNEEGLKNVVNSLLSSGVKLNSVIAPRLHQICSDVKQKLDFNEDIDFYIVSSVEFNAYSINGFGYVPHMICLTSSLVQMFKDDELAFVIGHEIGHIMFKHSQLSIVSSILSKSDSQSVSTQAQNIFVRWHKYAEISSDRMGFIAQPNLETVGKVFFKLASGLSEEHLNFNIQEYLKQLEHIKDMSRGDFFSSHPSSLVRLKCLELFSQSELYPDCRKTSINTSGLNEEMHSILDLLEYHPRTDDQKSAVEFIASVGMYVACGDRDINPNELEYLYSLLDNYTSQPEKYLVFNDYDEIVARKNAICEHYAETNNELKYWLCERMGILAICDGKFDESEKVLLFELAERLEIREERMREIIRWASGYMRPRGQHGSNFFKG